MSDTISFTPADIAFMSRAILLAKNGLYTSHPNPRVGCVIVKNDKRVAEGWHKKTGEPHAEINALHEAGLSNARDAKVYVTLEPCCHQGKTPPCTQALIKAGVKQVFIATLDPNPLVSGNGVSELQQHGIDVVVGLLATEAEAINPGFIKRMRTGRPYIRNKLAMSVDGRTAMPSGESKWITSSDARADVQKLRAQSDCIMTGVGTVLADNPSMTVRLKDTEQQPLRVVVDTHLSIPLDSKLLSEDGKTIIMTCREDPADVERLSCFGGEVVLMPKFGNNLDLMAIVDYLGQMQVNEVLLETGSTLSGAMLQADLVDELVIYMAPILLGNEAKGLFRLPGMDNMDQKIQLDIFEQRMVGCDWRLRARIKK